MEVPLVEKRRRDEPERDQGEHGPAPELEEAERNGCLDDVTDPHKDPSDEAEPDEERGE